MIPAQFHVDILSQLESLLPSYGLAVPSPVMDELENIKRTSRGRSRIAASVALKIAKSPPINIIPLELGEDEKVDDVLLRISTVLCTNDRELRKKARDRGIPVVYLRQRKYLAIDGHLKI
jgi:rRNA-processing protein FCF1